LEKRDASPAKWAPKKRNTRLERKQRTGSVKVFIICPGGYSIQLREKGKGRGMKHEM